MLPASIYLLASVWKFERYTSRISLGRQRSPLIHSLDWMLCRFPLIRNTSIAGFDPSLFRVVYSLFFVPLCRFSHSCLRGPPSFIHSEIRSLFPKHQGLPAKQETSSVWDSSRLKYCMPKDWTNFHKFFSTSLCVCCVLDLEGKPLFSCIKKNITLALSTQKKLLRFPAAIPNICLRYYQVMACFWIWYSLWRYFTISM